MLNLRNYDLDLPSLADILPGLSHNGGSDDLAHQLLGLTVRCCWCGYLNDMLRRDANERKVCAVCGDKI